MKKISTFTTNIFNTNIFTTHALLISILIFCSYTQSYGMKKELKKDTSDHILQNTQESNPKQEKNPPVYQRNNIQNNNINNNLNNKEQDTFLQKFSFKNIARAAKQKAKFYARTALGLLSACNGTLLGISVLSFLCNLRRIKQSKISNPAFVITKYLFKNFTSIYPLEKCIIPATVAILSVSAACSFYTSYHMLKDAGNA